VEVDGQALHFKKAVIASGARAVAPHPPIEGIEEAGYLTNETVFSLTQRPERLAVIGAGPIGCELAQAFARFGSEVTVFELTPHILPREDPDAAAVVQARMTHDGVRFAFDTTVDGVEAISSNEPDGGGKRIRYKTAGEAHEATVDEILVGVGRAPNVEGLGLDEAGVSYDRTGVQVDARLRTSNRRIYAAGDICFPFKFTHTADAMAQIVIQNALFPHPFGLGTASTESLNIPWCTYTEPEIAHVGMYEADARKQGIEVETFTQPLADVDRAVLDGEDAGFARVHVRKGTDRILGATIVAADAGNLITEVTVAMKAGAGLGTIGAAIHPYPTQAEALRKAANQMRKARFSERQRAILTRMFAWRR
jgi:pyruvate/2-oxoglutarate dehydrogenase complex dihydrolipoamide dehydrogenase (E3) component